MQNRIDSNDISREEVFFQTQMFEKTVWSTLRMMHDTLLIEKPSERQEIFSS